MTAKDDFREISIVLVIMLTAAWFILLGVVLIRTILKHRILQPKTG